MKPNLTVDMLRNTLILCLCYVSYVTAVKNVKTHSPLTWKYKMTNRCVPLRNYAGSCVYSSMEPHLTVLTLRNTLLCYLCHVTAVITVKTHSPMTWKYKMTNRCSFEKLRCKSCLQLHGATFDSWYVKGHFNTLLASRDSCHKCQNSLTSDLKV